MKSRKVMIFSAPSGSGKSTIVRHLMDRYPMLGFSVSATSRQPRGEETDGKEYYFLSVDDFKKRIKNNEFVEYQEVYKGCYYGTLKSEVERLWNDGKTILFDIDVVGAVNLKKLYGDDALALFVKPPSIEVLRERLVNRGTESEDAIEKRVIKAEYELSFENQFDKILVNDKLEDCLEEARKITEEFLL